MGCDIHVSIEVNIYEVWFMQVNNIRIDRNYRIFSLLADCGRGDCRPIADNRGLPKDVSYGTKCFFEREENDAHSMSWITFAELLEQSGEFEGEFFFGVMRLLANKYGNDKVRMVFWFDN